MMRAFATWNGPRGKLDPDQAAQRESWRRWRRQEGEAPHLLREVHLDEDRGLATSTDLDGDWQGDALVAPRGAMHVGLVRRP